MVPRTRQLAWTLFAGAVIAWCIAGLLIWRIGAYEGTYVAQAQSSQNSAAQAQAAAVARVAVQSSSEESAQLNAAISLDPVDFATIVNSIGSTSGATVQISSALPESLPPLASVPKGSPQLYAYGFSVQVNGSFSQLMRALELMQAIPAPSQIEEVDLGRSDSATGPAWQMDVQLRLVTTDNISS